MPAWGATSPARRRWCGVTNHGRAMNNIIYIVGLVVIVIVILGFLGLR
jgi:hypothetical protein